MIRSILFGVLCVVASTAFAQKLSPLQAPAPVQAPSKLTLSEPQTFAAPVLAAPTVATVRVPVTTLKPQVVRVPVTTFQDQIVNTPVTTFQDVPVAVNQPVANVRLQARGGCHPFLYRMTHPFSGVKSRSTTVTRTTVTSRG